CTRREHFHRNLGCTAAGLRCSQTRFHTPRGTWEPSCLQAAAKRNCCECFPARLQPSPHGIIPSLFVPQGGSYPLYCLTIRASYSRATGRLRRCVPMQKLQKKRVSGRKRKIFQCNEA